MKVEKINYPPELSSFKWDRCEKHSDWNGRFANSNHIKGGSQCTRKAHYLVDGAKLCKMHAGELLLLKALEEAK